MENGGSVLIKLLFCLVPMPLFSNFMVAAWFSTFYNPKLSPTSLTYDSHAPLQSFSIYLYAATMKSILMHDTVLSVSNYVKTYDSYNCLELITKPTRITTTSSTLIDHIYTNLPATKLTPGILINDLSDHLPVFVSVKSNISKKSLGPLLFALYINDLPSATKLTPTLFADDTVLSISGSNSTELQSIVDTFRAAWFRQFLQKKTAVFGCLTNAVAPPPIVLESCSAAQTDRPV